MTTTNVCKAHQIAIAKKTMKMNCVSVAVMGGMDHWNAATILRVGLPLDCTCRQHRYTNTKEKKQ